MDIELTIRKNWRIKKELPLKKEVELSDKEASHPPNGDREKKMPRTN